MLTYLININRGTPFAFKSLTAGFIKTWYDGCEIRKAYYTTSLALLLSLFLRHALHTLGRWATYKILASVFFFFSRAKKCVETPKLTSIAVRKYDDFLSTICQRRHILVDKLRIVVHGRLRSARIGVVASWVARRFEYVNIVAFCTKWHYERIVHTSGAERARDKDNAGL
jgi:hypothetical protein